MVVGEEMRFKLGLEELRIRETRGAMKKAWGMNRTLRAEVIGDTGHVVLPVKGLR